MRYQFLPSRNAPAFLDPKVPKDLFLEKEEEEKRDLTKIFHEAQLERSVTQIR